MAIGQFLAGAGVVGRGWREEETAQQQARQVEIATQEAKRLADYNLRADPLRYTALEQGIQQGTLTLDDLRRQAAQNKLMDPLRVQGLQYEVGSKGLTLGNAQILANFQRNLAGFSGVGPAPTSTGQPPVTGYSPVPTGAGQPPVPGYSPAPTARPSGSAGLVLPSAGQTPIPQTSQAPIAPTVQTGRAPAPRMEVLPAEDPPASPALMAPPVAQAFSIAPPITFLPLRGDTRSQAERDRATLAAIPGTFTDRLTGIGATGLNTIAPLVTGVANIFRRGANVIAGTDVYQPVPSVPQISTSPSAQSARLAEQERVRLEQISPTPNLPPTNVLTRAMTMVESGGDPKAVSSAGATGLMQVMPATAMNPGFGLPNIFDFAESKNVVYTTRNKTNAEELLKDPVIGAAYGQAYMDAMLKRYNGNLPYALAAYNAGPGRIDKWLADGADPKKLPKETREYVPKVLAQLNKQAGVPGAAPGAPAPGTVSGTPALGATAPAAAPVPGAAPTQAPIPGVPAAQSQRMLTEQDFFLANPEAAPQELQRLEQAAQANLATLTDQRTRALQVRQLAALKGDVNQVAQADANIGQIDMAMTQLRQQVTEKRTYLQGMQGLRELATANDPRRLANVLTESLGAPVAFLPRDDGTYSLFVNGRRIKEGMTSQQVANYALREFDPAARAAVSASAAKATELAQKLEFSESVAVAKINAAKDIRKAIIDGNFKLAEEIRKKEKLDIKPLGDGSGRLAVIINGETLEIVDPTPRTQVTPAGTINLAPTGQRVNLGK